MMIFGIGEINSEKTKSFTNKDNGQILSRRISKHEKIQKALKKALEHAKKLKNN